MAVSVLDAASRINTAAETAAEVATELAGTTTSIVVRDAAAAANAALAEVRTVANAVRTTPGVLGQDRRIAEAYEAAARVLKAAVVAVTGQDSSVLDEWKECRLTIDRFDKILVDLRKVGFSFITA